MAESLRDQVLRKIALALIRLLIERQGYNTTFLSNANQAGKQT